MRADNTAALAAASRRRAESILNGPAPRFRTSTAPAPPSPTPPSLTPRASLAPCSIAIPSYAIRSTGFDRPQPAAPDNPPPSA